MSTHCPAESMKGSTENNFSGSDVKEASGHDNVVDYHQPSEQPLHNGQSSLYQGSDELAASEMSATLETELFQGNSTNPPEHEQQQMLDEAGTLQEAEKTNTDPILDVFSPSSLPTIVSLGSCSFSDPSEKPKMEGIIIRQSEELQPVENVSDQLDKNASGSVTEEPSVSDEVSFDVQMYQTSLRTPKFPTVLESDDADGKEGDNLSKDNLEVSLECEEKIPPEGEDSGKTQDFVSSQPTSALVYDDIRVSDLSEQHSQLPFSSLPSACCLRLRCSEKFSEEEKLEMSRQFSGLETTVKLKLWLLKHVRLKKVVSKKSGKKRHKPFFYLSTPQGKCVKVCKQFFQGVLDLTGELTLKKVLAKAPHLSRLFSTSKPDHLGKKLRKVVIKQIRGKLRVPELVSCKPVSRGVGGRFGFVHHCYSNLVSTIPNCKVSYPVYRHMFSNIVWDTSEQRDASSYIFILLLRDAYTKAGIDIHSDLLGQQIISSESSLLPPPSLPPPSSSSKSEVGGKQGSREKTVIMQLDSESDAIVITQNMSDSESECESKDKQKTEKSTYLSEHSDSISEASHKVCKKFPLLPPCRCLRKCFMKISEVRRTEIHGSFWALKTYAEQKQWILDHIKHTVKASLVNGTVRRTTKRSFYLQDNGGNLVKVCCLQFLSTLGLRIKDPKLKLPSLVVSPSLTAVQGSSGKARGGRGRGKRLDGYSKACVEQHVQTYLLSGKKLPGFKEYNKHRKKQPRVTLKQMYSDFHDVQPNLNVSCAAYSRIYHKQAKLFKQTMPETHSVMDALDIKREPLEADSSLDYGASGHSMVSSIKEEPDVPLNSRKRRLRNSGRVNYNENTNTVVEYQPPPNKKRKSKTPKKYVAAAESEDGFDSSMEIDGDSSLSTVVSEIVTTQKQKKKRGRPRKVPRPQPPESEEEETLGESEVEERTRAEGKKKRYKHKLNCMEKKEKHPLLPPCDCKWRKCKQKIPESWRQVLHSYFWNLKSYIDRQHWMAQYVQKWEPRHRKFSLVPVRKNECRRYFLPVEDETAIEVCRVFFLHTLGFKWDGVVDEVLKSVPGVQTVHVQEPEKKNKSNRSQRKIPEIVVQKVAEFYDENEKKEQEADPPNPPLVGREKEKAEIQKIKTLFEEFREAHKNIFLGYHLFRRILRGILEERFLASQPPAPPAPPAHPLPPPPKLKKPAKKVRIARKPIVYKDSEDEEDDNEDEYNVESDRSSSPEPQQKKIGRAKAVSINRGKKPTLNRKPKIVRSVRKYVAKIPAAVINSVKDFWETEEANITLEKSNRGRKRRRKHKTFLIPGKLKLKSLFCEFRARYKDIYLGYHNFRKIIRSILANKHGQDELDSDSAEFEAADEEQRHFKKPRRKLPVLVIDTVKKFWEKKEKTIKPSSEMPLKKKRQYYKQSFLPDGVDIKDLFKEYREENKNIYIGYHNFRRILRSILHPEVVKIETYVPQPKRRPRLRQSLIAKRAADSTSTSTIDPATGEMTGYGMEGGDIYQDYNNSYMNYQDGELGDCILDVNSGMFRPPSSSVEQEPRPRRVYRYKKRKKGVLSQRNCKENYPMLSPCNCSKRKCFEKIPEERRKELHTLFWGLPTYNDRKQWMLENIERCEIKRRVVFYDEGKPKKHESRWYFFPDLDGSKIQVCKDFFLRTLGYKWDSVIDTIGKTVPKGEAVATPDKRGRRPPAHKITDEAVESMTQYIESICQPIASQPPPLPPPPARNSKGKKKVQQPSIIPYGLTMKHLFEDYKSKHPNHRFGYESFRKVFLKVKKKYMPEMPEETATTGNEEEQPEPKFDRRPANQTNSHTNLATATTSAPPTVNEDSVDQHEYLDQHTPTFHQEAPEMLPPPPQHQQHMTVPTYATIGQYSSPPPPSQPSHQTTRPNTTTNHVMQERKSCLYQYSSPPLEPQLPPAHHQPHLAHHNQHQPIQPMHGTNSMVDHYRPNMDNSDQFMKYNLYGGPAVPGTSNHFPQMPEPPLPYPPPPHNSRPHDMDPSSSNGAQFTPSYFMPNPEPFRRQVYHHMASQYQSILHHIAESNRIFNYGGFPPAADNNFQPAHAHDNKMGHFPGRQDFTRDLQNQPSHFPTMKPPQHFNPVQHSLPTGYVDHHSMDGSLHHHEGNSMDLASYSDDNDAGYMHAPTPDMVVRDPQTSTGYIDTLQQPSTSGPKGKGKKRERAPRKPKEKKVKIKRERKIKQKSMRNYGDHYPMLPPCNCKKKKCNEKFPEEKRQKIHDAFWDLKNYNERKQWMLEKIKRTDPKRRREIIGDFKKSESRWYYFQDEEGNDVEICKTFFLHTLGYKWDSVIDTIKKTTPRGETVSKPDMRGRKPPSHKLSNVVIKSVIQYVESMQQAAEPFSHPRVKEAAEKKAASGETNASKPNSHLQIPYGLTMKDLFDDYKAKHAGHKIGYESFRRIYKGFVAGENMLNPADRDVEHVDILDDNNVVDF